MFPKHIGSSEKIDGVALSRSRLGASTRGFEIVAPPFDGSIDKIGMIYALCGQANFFAARRPEVCVHFLRWSQHREQDVLAGAKRRRTPDSVAEGITVVAQFVAGAAGSACPINSADAVVKCRNEWRESSSGWNGPYRLQRASCTPRRLPSKWEGVLVSALVHVIGAAESFAA
jgi:hypothetical protein